MPAVRSAPFVELPGTATVLTLGAHMCKWPIGDPSSNDFTFCGRRAGEDGPYCNDHARLAYQHYERVFSSLRWAALSAAGARPQRPLWASTSVKDPAYPDTRYVVDLVAPGVVNTMPEATLRLVAEHGQVPADSVHGHYDESQQVLDRLERLGIHYDDVTQELEDNGVRMFDAAWDRLGEQLAATLRARSAAQSGS